jgi:hypothetical protein
MDGGNVIRSVMGWTVEVGQTAKPRLGALMGIVFSVCELYLQPGRFIPDLGRILVELP